MTTDAVNGLLSVVPIAHIVEKAAGLSSRAEANALRVPQPSLQFVD